MLYGANGAGKSNLFKALEFLQEIAIRRRPKDSCLDREPFLLHGKNALTTFDVQFVSRNKLFRYSVSVDDVNVVKEALVWIKNATESRIYERVTAADGRVEVVLDDVESDDENWAKVKALATVGGPRNQSFLATLRVTMNRLPAHEKSASNLTRCADMENAIRVAVGEYNKTNLKREHFVNGSVEKATLRAERLDSTVLGCHIPEAPTTRIYKLI